MSCQNNLDAIFPTNDLQTVSNALPAGAYKSLQTLPTNIDVTSNEQRVKLHAPYKQMYVLYKLNGINK